MNSSTLAAGLISCCSSPFTQLFTTSTVGRVCRDEEPTEVPDMEGTLYDALCYVSQISELEALANAGVNDPSGDALVSCAQENLVDAVDMLLRRMSYDKDTLTHMLMRVVKTTVSMGPVRLLVEAGAEVTLKTLCASMRDDLPEVTRFVLSIGGINVLHEMDDLPLRVAASRGYHEVVGMLLAEGADVHAAGDDALQQAAYAGSSRVVKVLLAAGADATRVDLYNVDAEITVGMLVNAGATDPNSYALRNCAYRGATSILRLLGTRLHYTKEQREAALMVAVNEKRLEAVMCLLWAFPNVEVLRALYVAIDQDNPVTARLLMPRLPEDMQGHVVDRTVALGKRSVMDYWLMHGLPLPSMEALKMAADLGHMDMLHDVLACMDSATLRDVMEYSHVIMNTGASSGDKPHSCALKLGDSRSCS